MDTTQERLLIYQALLVATASLSAGGTPYDVLKAACDGLVASSRAICLAWMYLGDPDSEDVRPQYVVGRSAEYAHGLVIDHSEEAKRGPGRRSLASGEPVLVHVASDPTFGRWRAEALRWGFQDGLTLPVGQPGTLPRGMIVIFADTLDYFQRVGVEPFIAFGQIAGVALDQAKLKVSLQQAATIDPTSGLFNRRALLDCIGRTHAQAERSGNPYSFLLLDLDRFKLLNDNYGHALGDEMLGHVGQVLGHSLRAGDVVGRWGGEEFLAILPDTSQPDAVGIAERVRAQVECFTIEFNRERVSTTASLGVASFPRDGDTPEFLLKAADAALYEAKKTGRNRVVAVGAKHEVYSLAAKIGSALAAHRLVAAYQPIVDLKTGRVMGDEALARLIDEDGHPVEAIHFIAAAAELQMTHLIDFEVITRTIRHCSDRMARGSEGIAHFVNVSGDLLLHQELVEALFAEAQSACNACGLEMWAVKPLVLEITERQLLGDMAAVKAKLAPFLDFGMRLAVDDFGSGYSSFQYLADLPVSFLKIEGDLIARVRDPRVRKIVGRIQDIARDLDLTTVAEFVEDGETAEILQALGVDWAQGYFFGRPQLVIPSAASASPESFRA
ncbi:MAG: EAL domain-containing protein [Betaproteobacteria bacterium]|nr:EAL domain-containing protein [Betaproteobacteria bacterium]